MKKLFLLLIVIGWSGAPGVATARTDTSFTYQGTLNQNGSPVDNFCDFRFRLYNAADGGSQIGSTETYTSILVSDGGFAIELDFGADPFDNTARWLQIDVRCPAGSGSYTTLTPRQPITRSPYAIQTRGLFVDENQYVGVGTNLPATPFHLVGSNAIMQTITSTNTAGTWIDLENTSSGGKRWSLLSTGSNNGEGTGKMLLRSITDGRTVMTLDGTGFVGVGRSTPITGSEIFGIRAQTGGFGGMYVETTGPQGDPFYGYSTAGEVDAYHYLDGSTGIWHLVNGGQSRLSVSQFGTVSIGHNLNVLGVDVTAILASTQGDGFSGVKGIAAATSGVGVHGVTDGVNPLSAGVQGYATSDSGANFGVIGQSESSIGRGVAGVCLATTGVNIGVLGISNSSSGFDFFAGGAGFNYGSTSSRRWKRNIQPITDPLAKLNRLRGVRFEWDPQHGGHQDIGMIAEEVGTVLPEIVQFEENGTDAFGMDYSKLTPLLTEAVKELNRRCQAKSSCLEQRLQAIESENQQLRERISTLESIVQEHSNRAK